MKTNLMVRTSRFIFAGLLALSLLSAQAQTSVPSGGRIVRGSGTNMSNETFVIPLDGQQGVLNGPSLTNLYSHIATGVTNIYHLNATNTASQSLPANRYLITNAVAAFGSRYGGSPLYTGQNHRFGTYAGSWYTSGSSIALVITLVNSPGGTFSTNYYFDLPVPGNSNDWSNFVTNGLTRVFQVPGLTTTFAAPGSAVGPWGLTNSGGMLLSHVADSTATNYEYTFWVVGSYGANWMVIGDAGQGFWDPVYTLDFDPVPAGQPAFVRQPQFQGTPLPPAYEGKSLTELLAAKAAVTNAVDNAATNWTDLDNSPELRDSPILDQFVSDMGSNALALAAYVFNQIELTDAVAYNSNTNSLADISVNLGGINRSALGTYLEGQGSPAEQCALLIYLLRRAGVPAAYIYGPTDGVQMLDTRLSAILQMQLHGAANTNGNVYTTNSLVSVNYPWVAAYINGQWTHLFPWIKNTEVAEGLNLYDYLPTNYNSGYKWVSQYITGDTNIFSLNSESDLPSVLLPAFIQQSLLSTGPGLSIDDLGVQVVNRPVEFSQWSDFPTPFAVTNGSVNTVHDLTSITNLFPGWTNIWDTFSVRVYSSVHTNLSLFTGDLRIADLQDRKFLVRHQTNTTNFTLTLSLAPYRPALTNVMAFTNDAGLLHQEAMTMALSTNDDPITIVFNRKRHRTEPSSVTNTLNSYLDVFEELQNVTTKSIRLGDLATINLHSGRVSKPMLRQWAQEYWSMQQSVKANPSITNTLSPDITQGTLPYLMGMAYYERLGRFQPVLEHLHKVNLGTVIGQGLSVLAAKRQTNGTLVLPITLVHPHVDMNLVGVSAFCNSELRPDEGSDINQMFDSFYRLLITEGSAQEHQITENFYGQSDGISSVRLLLQAQQPGQPGMTNLTWENYTSFNSLASYDSTMWNTITNIFASNQFANVFITLKPVTNTLVSYQGMGCLVYSEKEYDALISGNGLPANGGWGIPLFDPIYNPPDYNYVDLSYNTSADDNWSVSYSAPTIFAPEPLPETVATWDFPSFYDDLSSGAISYGGPDIAQQQQFDVASASLGFTGAGALQDTVNNGGFYDAHVGEQYAQLASGVADPVNAVTGEFYIDATDISLPGPMPLIVRRNYSSLDVDLGDSPFGYGWRPAFAPYLRVVTNNVIFACEMDGTVVAYRQPTPGTNYWKPTAADNPQLNNRSSKGIGSTANLFNNYITNAVVSGVTNFYLNGADGSVRFFQYTNFPVAGTTGSFDRNRPYLKTWTDANGNSYNFSFQTDSTQPDFGQLKRVQSSNGNFVEFYYDVFAHITEAIVGDQRELLYDYDDYGDLVTVTLPDESQINYVYQHTNSVTNGVTNIYSTHLIAQEQKPNGRTLANAYDALRRVTVQQATVGTNLALVTNAVFTYSNSFTNLTNSIITGTTYIFDVFGHTNTYLYTSNQITSVTDQLGQTVTQVWFSNTNDPGYYPHSLKSMTDKRGLKTSFQYDASGNFAQATYTGNLTGTGFTNETATYAFTYMGRNLLSTATDPSTNQTAYYYTDTARPMSPTMIVELAGTTPLTTNQYFYTNVVQIVTNGAVLATNSAYGLVQGVLRGGFDASDFLYDGHGFLTQSTRSTRTGDPAQVTTFFYTERGEVEQQTDALGRSHHFAYDDLGRTTEDEVYEAGATTPEGFNYSYYNENGDLVWTDGSRYNPEDYIWRDYDGAGRKITEMRWRSEAKADGSGVQAPAATTNQYATTFYHYDAFNNLVQITDPMGNYVAQSFDAIGQKTKQVFYASNGTTMATNYLAYEPGGQVSAATNALGGITTKQYNSQGKLTSQSNPDGSTNGWTFYLDGRPHKQFLPNGNFWETIYDDAHRKVVRFFHNGGGILSSNVVVMDTRGNVATNIDLDGNVFTNFYDGLDRLKIAAGPYAQTVAILGPNPLSTNYVTNVFQQVTTYFYDAAGQTLTTSNALGETTVTTSDALGRPTQVAIYPSNSVTPVRITSTFYSADHQSITVSNGTGAGAIVSTTYSDNDGHPILQIDYPTNGVTEFVLHKYDLAGNCVASQQCSSNAGGITIWATNGWTYDGLNRAVTETSQDGAKTSYTLDALGNVLNCAMPGSLTWSATYTNDGRVTSEEETGGGLTARSVTYQYYGSGSPFAGLLQLATDGRSTTWSNSYDDYLRLASVTTSGTTVQQQTLTTISYLNSGDLASVSQSFSNVNYAPSTTVSRSYDGYHEVTAETVSLGGSPLSTASQGWGNAGRRTLLNKTAFAYQADGRMTNAGSSTFAYANNGLLTSRTNSSRIYTINQRDGRGRVTQATTSVNGAAILTENLTYRNDGRMSAYTANRDFNDIRSYGYSAFAQRLTNEIFNVGTGLSVTNKYTIDAGTNGGLGILTAKTASGNAVSSWAVPTNGVDGLSRVTQSQNSLLNRSSWGLALGAASVSATLDGKPVSVDYDTSEGGGSWRADLDLSTGSSHTLTVSAVDSTGVYFGHATNTFTTTNTAGDTIQSTHDGNGNMTLRVWVNAVGVTNRTQALTWDAFDRLIAVTDRDPATNGFNWTASYDAFGRRLSTGYTMVISNTPIVDPPDAATTIDSTFDPQVEFLETSVTVNGNATMKNYGPDASGTYGGMQGVGGLEGTRQKGFLNPYGVVQDIFGNIIGTISNSTVVWNPTRCSSYGPVPGYQSPALSLDTGLAQALGWRGQRIDETGFINLGARHYDPVAGRFLGADPFGHGASKDLYSFCGGDPLNRFDPTGRFGKQIGDAFSYDTSSMYRDYVGEAHSQEIYNQVGSFIVNLATLGIADPILQLTTGYGFNGEYVDKSVAAENLYLSTLLALPLFVPGAGTADLLLREAGEDLLAGAAEEGLIGAGEQTLVEEGESAVLWSEGGQEEFGFAGSDLSGRLTGFETSAAETTTQMEFNFGKNISVYNARTSPSITQSVLNNIDPTRFNPETRFGAAFYVAEEGGTAVAEVGYHGASSTHVIRYNMNLSSANVLDLSNASTASAWGYTGGNSYLASQAIAVRAQQAGFNAIRYPSLRGPGNNYAIFSGFDDILSPQMVSPVPKP